MADVDYRSELQSMSHQLGQIVTNEEAILSALGYDKTSFRNRNTNGHRGYTPYTGDRTATRLNEAIKERSVKDLDTFLDRFEAHFINEFAGESLRKGLDQVADSFKSKLSDSIKPEKIADSLAEGLSNAFKGSRFQQAINNSISGVADSLTKAISGDKGGALSSLKSIAPSLLEAGAGIGIFAGVIAGITQRMQTIPRDIGNPLLTLGHALGFLLPGVEDLTNLLQFVGSNILKLLGIEELKTKIKSAVNDLIIKPAKEVRSAFIDFLVSPLKMISTEMTNSFNRLKADVDQIVRYPFQILEKAANELYSSWDTNLRMVTARTGISQQGYYDLYKEFASELTGRGYGSTISSTSVMEQYSNLLASGITGNIAKTLAVESSILNNAIPGFDASQYSQQLASYAYNLTKGGMDEAAAIKKVVEQLYYFADSLLYASDNVAGGFSTVLKDGTNLLNDLLKVARTSGMHGGVQDIRSLSSVFTAMQAVAGSQAPDIASNLISAMLGTLTGGNASNIVALRSLANINASNSAFLTQALKDPSTVFGSIFSRLGELQNSSSSAFMEVAEGLSSIFGLSTDQFARFNFGDIAKAISNVSLFGKSSTILGNKLGLLGSGTTTTIAEQSRIEKINELLNTDGLAAVLANEETRAMQEHLWQEEIANKITKSQFSVNLIGSALTFLQGISSAVELIKGILTGEKTGSNIIDAYIEDLTSYTSEISQLLLSNHLGTDFTEYNKIMSYGVANGGSGTMIGSSKNNLASFVQNKLIDLAKSGMSWDDITQYAKENLGIQDLAGELLSRGADVGKIITTVSKAYSSFRVGEGVGTLPSLINLLQNGIDDVLGEKGFERLFTIAETNFGAITGSLGSLGWDLAKAWMDIQLESYKSAFDPSAIKKIEDAKDKEKNDALYAYADALAESLTGADLTNPTVQTNALLGQIMQLLTVITNSTTSNNVGLGLPDTMRGLGYGLITK